jgi:hypothetical protein
MIPHYEYQATGAFEPTTAAHHKLAVAFEEALRDERITAEWYAKNPDYTEKWADLFGEHVARLTLLEKIERATR